MLSDDGKHQKEPTVSWVDNTDTEMEFFKDNIKKSCEWCLIEKIDAGKCILEY